MDKKLIQDYLNKNSHIVDEKVVVKNYTDNGTYVTAFCEWQNEEGLKSNYLNIPLFDLMVFIYSKI